MLLLADNMMSAGPGAPTRYTDVRKRFPLEQPERSSIPFSSERKMMSTIVPCESAGPRWGGRKRVYRMFTKGAADFVLKVSRPLCGFVA